MSSLVIVAKAIATVLVFVGVLGFASPVWRSIDDARDPLELVTAGVALLGLFAGAALAAFGVWAR